MRDAFIEQSPQLSWRPQHSREYFIFKVNGDKNVRQAQF